MLLKVAFEGARRHCTAKRQECRAEECGILVVERLGRCSALQWGEKHRSQSRALILETFLSGRLGRCRGEQEVGIHGDFLSGKLGRCRGLPGAISLEDSSYPSGNSQAGCRTGSRLHSSSYCFHLWPLPVLPGQITDRLWPLTTQKRLPLSQF